jgi:hypothetical protein
MRFERLTLGVGIIALCSATAIAGDWTNYGGNQGRNSRSDEIGPTGPDELWSAGPSSIITWNVLTAGERVFSVRQFGFPGDEPNVSPVVCYDLNTGVELWRTDIPFNAGDWTTWIAGTSNGLVYAGRSGNGASVWAKLYALDQATGDVVWISDDEISAGAYDGVVFAPDGDPVIGSFDDIWRIDADTGATVWHTERIASVSGSCGVAIQGDAVYACNVALGEAGQRIFRYDLATGDEEYQAPLMDGFLVQNMPIAADGNVYFPRTDGGNPVDDFAYAFEDDGTQMTTLWTVPVPYSVNSQYGVAPDGTVHVMVLNDADVEVLAAVDPSDGTIRAISEEMPNFSKPLIAIDQQGKVYYSDGGWPSTLFGMDEDLNTLWSVPVPNMNIGAPALAEHGTLVFGGTNLIRAFRSDAPPCEGDLNGDGFRDLADLGILLASFQIDDGGDIDGDGDTDLADLGALLAVFGIDCP